MSATVVAQYTPGEKVWYYEPNIQKIWEGIIIGVDISVTADQAKLYTDTGQINTVRKYLVSTDYNHGNAEFVSVEGVNIYRNLTDIPVDVPTPTPTPTPGANDPVALSVAVNSATNEYAVRRYSFNQIDTEFSQVTTLENGLGFDGANITQIGPYGYSYVITRNGGDSYLTFFTLDADGLHNQTDVLVQAAGPAVATTVSLGEGEYAVAVVSFAYAGSGEQPMYIKMYQFDGEEITPFGETFTTTTDRDITGTLQHAFFQTWNNLIIVQHDSINNAYLMRGFGFTGTTFEEGITNSHPIAGGGPAFYFIKFIQDRLLFVEPVTVDDGEGNVATLVTNAVFYNYNSAFGFELAWSMPATALGEEYVGFRFVGQDNQYNQLYLSAVSFVNNNEVLVIGSADVFGQEFVTAGSIPVDWDTGEPYAPTSPYQGLGMTRSYTLTGDVLERLVSFEGGVLVTKGPETVPQYGFVTPWLDTLIIPVSRPL